MSGVQHPSPGDGIGTQLLGIDLADLVRLSGAWPEQAEQYGWLRGIPAVSIGRHNGNPRSLVMLEPARSPGRLQLSLAWIDSEGTLHAEGRMVPRPGASTSVGMRAAIASALASAAQRDDNASPVHCALCELTRPDGESKQHLKPHQRALQPFREAAYRRFCESNDVSPTSAMAAIELISGLVGGRRDQHLHAAFAMASLKAETLQRPGLRKWLAALRLSAHWHADTRQGSPVDPHLHLLPKDCREDVTTARGGRAPPLARIVAAFYQERYPHTSSHLIQIEGLDYQVDSVSGIVHSGGSAQRAAGTPHSATLRASGQVRTGDGRVMFARGDGDPSPPAGGAAEAARRAFVDRWGGSSRHFDPVDAPAGFVGAGEAIEKLFGKRIQFIRLAEDCPQQFDGFCSARVRDTVFVNIEAERPILAVAMHEVLHAMRNDSPEQFDRTAQAMHAFLKPDAINAWRLRNLEMRAALSTRDAIEELIADTLGDQAMRAEFWEEIARRADPSALKALLDLVMNVLRKLIHSLAGVPGFQSTAHWTDINSAAEAVTNFAASYAQSRAHARLDAYGRDDDRQPEALRHQVALISPRRAMSSAHFRQWIGSSKAIGRDGMPLVLYGPEDGWLRGAGAPFVTDPEIAETLRQDGQRGPLAPAFLKLERPRSVEVSTIEEAVALARRAPSLFMTAEQDAGAGDHEPDGLHIKVRGQDVSVFVPREDHQVRQACQPALKADQVRSGLVPGRLTQMPSEPRLSSKGETKLSSTDGSTMDPREEALRAWGMGTVVADRDGRPKAVYHGTSADFESFDLTAIGDLGFHFGTIRQANHFAKRKGGVVLPVYLSLRNPIALRDTFDAKTTSAQDVIWQIETLGALPKSQCIALRELSISNHPDGRQGVSRTWFAIREALKGAGFDGVIYKNDNHQEGQGVSYIVFSPTQIKSAIGNSGAFDQVDPRITMSSQNMSYARDRGIQGAARHERDTSESSIAGGKTVGSSERTDTEAFKRWFGDSKVVDDAGKPLVLYHGTKADFSEFSDEYLGEGNGFADWGDGFYFATNPKAANNYANGQGGNVMPVYLSIKNPAPRSVMLSDEVQDAISDDMGWRSVRDVLGEMGYDGIAIDHGADGVEYIAFRPEQIKSATGNRGTFDPEDPRISMSSIDKPLGRDDRAQSGTASNEHEIFEASLGGGQSVNSNKCADTESFKRWFGDSKVVDADGKPLVVYHGTTGDFTRFRRGDEGIFFAESPSAANSYAEGDGANVMPAYLSIKNPLRMTWREWLRGNTDSGINHHLEGNEGLLERGYDGVVLTEPDTNDPAASSVTYIAFRPEQIKSAIGNRGTFDPGDPRISMSVRDCKGIGNNDERESNTITDSESFKRWFGDSKVVDAAGRPLIMYHGTDRSEGPISAFDTEPVTDIGAHFGTSTQANNFVSDDKGELYPVFLSIKNPIRLQDWGSFCIDDVQPQLDALGIPEPKNHASLMEGDYLRARIMEAGYDGVVYLNRRERTNPFAEPDDNIPNSALQGITDDQAIAVAPHLRDSYIALSPAQIKSALGNLGTFDPNDLRISMSSRDGSTTNQTDSARKVMRSGGPR